MASRGRGRGAGINPPPSPGVVESRVAMSDSKGANAPLPGGGKAGATPSSQKTPSTIQELKKYLMSLNEENFEKYGKAFGTMVVDFIKKSPEKRSGEVAALLYETVTTSSNHATLGGRVSAEVLNPDTDKDTRALLRKDLFRMCQSNYKQKETIRTRSVEEWLGIFAFVSELYRFVRVSGSAITTLGKAVQEGMAFMLDNKDCTDDEVDCICGIVKTTGPMLESTPEQAKQFNGSIVNKLRALAVRRQTSENLTCQVMELLEYRAGGYKDPRRELKDFYVDEYADAVARNEMFLAGINN